MCDFHRSVKKEQILVWNVGIVCRYIRTDTVPHGYLFIINTKRQARLFTCDEQKYTRTYPTPIYAMNVDDSEMGNTCGEANSLGRFAGDTDAKRTKLIMQSNNRGS